MAQFQEGNHGSFVAAADLSAKQYYIMKLTTTENSIDIASAATQVLVGVLVNKPKINETADVYLRNAAGTGKVIAGGTIAIGDKLTSDGNGKAIATTTAGDQVIGYALEVAASGDIFKYLPALDRV